MLIGIYKNLAGAAARVTTLQQTIVLRERTKDD
jgi:hypothetical protein